MITCFQGHHFNALATLLVLNSGVALESWSMKSGILFAQSRKSAVLQAKKLLLFY